MDNAKLFRIGGLSAILSGIAIIAGKILAMISLDRYGEFFDYLSPLFGLFAVTAIYLWHKNKTGIFGFVAYTTLFTGISMVLCLDYFGAFILPYLPVGTVEQLLKGPTATALSVSGFIFISGIILFGIVTIRAGILPVTASLLFIFGFIPVPLGDLLPVEVVFSGSVVAGSGLLWWGIFLYRYQVQIGSNEVDPD